MAPKDRGRLLHILEQMQSGFVDGRLSSPQHWARQSMVYEYNMADTEDNNFIPLTIRNAVDVEEGPQIILSEATFDRLRQCFQIRETKRNCLRIEQAPVEHIKRKREENDSDSSSGLFSDVCSDYECKDLYGGPESPGLLSTANTGTCSQSSLHSNIPRGNYTGPEKRPEKRGRWSSDSDDADDEVD